MAEFKILLKPSAATELAELPAAKRSAVLAAIEALAAEPRPAAAERLSERQRYRLRLDGGRLLWSVEEGAGRVLVIGLRRD